MAQTEGMASRASQPNEDADPALIALASKMRMNTPLRRTIFIAVMGSKGVASAVQRVGALGLKGAQEREIVRVLVDCCG